jgi:hypothetical protein
MLEVEAYVGAVRLSPMEKVIRPVAHHARARPSDRLLPSDGAMCGMNVTDIFVLSKLKKKHVTDIFVLSKLKKKQMKHVRLIGLTSANVPTVATISAH